jgi:hypothetical protein
MQTMCVVFAYFGPETVMPMTSVIATFAAVVLMFGKTLFRFAVGWVRTAWYVVRRNHAASAPHFTVGRPRHGVIEAGTAARASEASE